MKMKKLKTYKIFINEGYLNFFNKENSLKRKTERKEKYSKKIDDSIQIFNKSLKMLNIDNDWNNIETFIDTYSNLTQLLDLYYTKCVDNDDDYTEYKLIYDKIKTTVSQIKKFKFKLTGWSINYDPQEILDNATKRLIVHKNRIENYK